MKFPKEIEVEMERRLRAAVHKMYLSVGMSGPTYGSKKPARAYVIQLSCSQVAGYLSTNGSCVTLLDPSLLTWIDRGDANSSMGSTMMPWSTFALRKYVVGVDTSCLHEDVEFIC